MLGSPDRLNSIYEDIAARFLATSNVLGQKDSLTEPDESSLQSWAEFSRRIEQYVKLFGIDLSDQYVAPNLLLALADKTGHASREASRNDPATASQLFMDSILFTFLAKDVHINFQQKNVSFGDHNN